MPTYNINIQVQTGNASVQINNLTKQANELDKALKFLGAIAGAKQLMEMSDAYTVITNKLAVVTEGQYELNNIMSKTFDMAQQNRISWEALANTYSRIRRATEQLGLSQKETLTITDSITKLLKVGGATTQEAASVMLHLTHAFDEGRLHGRQLNLVMMESIPIAQAIAKEMGVTTGELRALGKAGLITGDVLARAFLHANGDATKAFAETLPTIKERFVQLKNAAEQWLGEANKGTGIATGFGDAIGFLTNHLDALADVLLVVLAGQVIPRVIAGFEALTVAMLANPAAAIAIGVVAAGGAIVALGDALSGTTKEQAKLNEEMYQAAAATDDFSKSLTELQDQHKFLPQLFSQIKLSSFDMIEAWVQNVGLLRRAMEDIADTGAKIQIAKIKAATGGEGFEGAVIRIAKTSKKINDEAEQLAKWWAQVAENAREADEMMTKIAAQQFAPSVSSLLTPVERDTLDLNSGVAQFGKNQAAARANAKNLSDFTKGMFSDLKNKDRADRQQFSPEDLNHDTFIDQAEGTKAAFKDIAAEAKRSGDLTRDAWVNAFHASEDALAHFLRTGEFNFKSFTDGILDDLAKIIARQAILTAIGGVSGGGWSAAAGAAAIGAAGGGFANGGSFRVGGNGGVDNNLVAFRASRNETVSVSRPAAGSTTAPSAASGDGVTVINQFDPRDMLAVLSTPHGQRVVNESVRMSGGFKRVTR